MNSGSTRPPLTALLSAKPGSAQVPAEQWVGLAALGGKGRALAGMVAAGDPVPSTGVITTAAYNAVASQPNVQKVLREIQSGRTFEDEALERLFLTATVPAAVRQEVLGMVRKIGAGGAVAIRSSATVEDLHGSSFAGQYRSFLEIDSEDDEAVLDAVRRVWASLWNAAPTAYRRAFGVPDADVAMAVVVMRMINATSAGVVFTADPAGADGARVESVEGLGESLVSGQRTPSAWVVPTGDIPNELPPAVGRALTLARRVESRLGVPQDVEWAAVGDDVFLVQSRPITVLELDDGFDTAPDDHELTTGGIVEMVPGVLPPLRWEMNRFILEEAFRSVLDNLGIIRGTAAEDHPFVRRIRGRAAIDFDQLRDAAAGIPRAVEELERQYFGLATESRADPHQSRWRITGGWRRVSQDIRALQTRRKVVEQADVVIAATAGLSTGRLVLRDLSDRALLAYSARLIDLAARGLAAELGVAATGATAYERLGELLQKHLPITEANHLVQELTAGSTTGVTMDRAASAAVFCGPTWTELETEPLKHIESAGPSFEQNIDSLRRRLTGLQGWKTRRYLTGQVVDIRLHVILRAVRELREQLNRREAAKAAVLRLGGEARRVHAELGYRLTTRTILGDAEDIELLSCAEVSLAIQGSLKITQDVLQRRRNWVSRFEAEGPLPIRFAGAPDRTPQPLPEGDVLTGWSSSPGRRSGVARTVTDPKATLAKGEILVAVSTDASWSPLFVRAGAVVVEQGGPLSHAAILARELGLPAVLNVPGATRVLDGCVVTVDGDQGVVVIQQRAEGVARPPQAPVKPAGLEKSSS